MLKCIDFHKKKLIWDGFVASRRQPVWTGSSNALFLTRKNIDLKLFSNLEASQLVWEGSLSAQMH